MARTARINSAPNIYKLIQNNSDNPMVVLIRDYYTFGGDKCPKFVFGGDNLLLVVTHHKIYSCWFSLKPCADGGDRFYTYIVATLSIKWPRHDFFLRQDFSWYFVPFSDFG